VGSHEFLERLLFLGFLTSGQTHLLLALVKHHLLHSGPGLPVQIRELGVLRLHLQQSCIHLPRNCTVGFACSCADWEEDLLLEGEGCLTQKGGRFVACHTQSLAGGTTCKVYKVVAVKLHGLKHRVFLKRQRDSALETISIP